MFQPNCLACISWKWIQGYIARLMKAMWFGWNILKQIFLYIPVYNNISFSLMSSECEMNFIACIFQNVNSQDVEFQLRFTLYDAANKCFFGSTWLGPYFSSSAKENGRHSLTCDEVKIVVIYICKCAHAACKVVYDSLGPVDFTLGSWFLFLTCLTGKCCFFGEIQSTEGL